MKGNKRSKHGQCKRERIYRREFRQRGAQIQSAGAGGFLGRVVRALPHACPHDRQDRGRLRDEGESRQS